jgi:hypothetical protein
VVKEIAARLPDSDLRTEFLRNTAAQIDLPEISSSLTG